MSLFVLCLATVPAHGQPAAEPAAPVGYAGLSSAGGVGLLALPTAQLTAADGRVPWQLRVGLFLHGFGQSDFLIAGDRTSVLGGGVHFDAILGRHAELWVLLGANSQRNDRPAASREDPPTIVSLGDVGLGLKLAWRLRGPLHVGLQPYLQVSSSAGDIGSSLATTSAGIDGLATLDLGGLLRALPLRLHLRVGYLHDRSAELLSGRQCALGGSGSSTGTVYDCVYSRIVTISAYGIRQPRVRVGIGADALFSTGRYLALGPIAEYHVEAITGDGDDRVRNDLASRIGPDLLEGRVAQWLDLGLRVQTAAHLTVDLGLQAGMSSPGYAMGTPVPQFMGYGALTVATDLLPLRAAPAPPPREAAPPPPSQSMLPPLERPEARLGRIRGVVREQKSGRPLAGAVVRILGAHANALLADDQGGYETAPLPPGTVTLEASHGDHERHRVEVTVLPGQTVQADLLLPARPAQLRVDVVDEAGQPIPAFVTIFRDREKQEVPPDVAGGFAAEAAPGAWTVHVESEGFLSREQPVVMSAGVKQHLNVALRRRPRLSAVRLGTDYIQLKGTIGFRPTTAELAEGSTALLDEIADLLLAHPELRKVRIEGHTDNVGNPKVNQKLSEERAMAVRSYLIKQGVEPDRLVAEGYGSAQPLVPNLSRTARLKNRRVAFRILERGP